MFQVDLCGHLKADSQFINSLAIISGQTGSSGMTNVVISRQKINSDMTSVVMLGQTEGSRVTTVVMSGQTENSGYIRADRKLTGWN